MKKFLVTLAVGLAATVAAPALISHADGPVQIDACSDDGRTTLVFALPCGPDTPTVAEVCARRIAHFHFDPDYCDIPRSVVVGELQLGGKSMPALSRWTRLDVAMRRTSLASMRFRCARLGGSRLVASHGFQVCRGVDWSGR